MTGEFHYYSLCSLSKINVDHSFYNNVSEVCKYNAIPCKKVCLKNHKKNKALNIYSRLIATFCVSFP